MLTRPRPTSRPRRYSPPPKRFDWRTAWTRFFQAVLLPWSRLVRLPNLFTVPGDILGGMVLAAVITRTPINGWSLLGMSVVSLLLYSFGTK